MYRRESAQMQKKRTKLYIALAALAVLALVVGFVLTGGNRELTKQVVNSGSREQLDELTASLGIGGYVTIVLLSMLQTLCPFLPAEPVQLLGGVAYGFCMGLALFAIGFALAVSIIYFLYKVYGEKLQDYFVKEMHLDVENVSKSNRVSLLIFILYFLPGIPYAMICFIYASLGVKFRKYMLVNLIGSIPSLCMGVGLGHVTVMSENSWIISAALFVVLVTIMAVLLKKKEWLFDKVNKLATASGAAEEPASHRHPADGVSYVLSLCPRCEGRNTLRTKKRKLRCKSCGLQTEMDADGNFTGDFRFESLDRWYCWQKEKLQPERETEYAVTLCQGDYRDKRLPRTVGEGTCIVGAEGLRYSGTRNGEETRLTFDWSQVCCLQLPDGESFAVCEGDRILSFLPEDVQLDLDWHRAATLIHKLHSEN